MLRSRWRCATTSWNERFFESTRGRIVGLLRRGAKTVEELAQSLEITDNAVRAQLTSLERDGLVRQAGVRRGFRKPSFAYQLDSRAAPLFPKPYPAVLSELLTVASERYGKAAAHELLGEAGRRLGAASREGRPESTVEQRVDRVVELIGQLGGLAEVEEAPDAYVVHGYDCLLHAIVNDHPEACETARSLIEEYVGAPVQECCERADRPHCQFRIARQGQS